jgi:acyl-CoA synthetase (AMP-forming)/AMP-acid ligase II
MDGERMMDCTAMGEVQAILAAFPGLDDVTVAEQDAESAGSCLVAYVTPDSVDLAALREYARKHLPAHLVPAVIMVRDAIPAAATPPRLHHHHHHQPPPGSPPPGAPAEAA